VALAGVAGWLVLGKTILHYTVGPEFIDTYSTIAILLAAISAAWFGLAFSPTLLALQRWREFFVIKLSCTALFFAFAAVLVPRLGIDGAAVAQLICYAAEVGFAFAVIHHALKSGANMPAVQRQ
jgi:O-antigen/teichoic acid export membrane protein